MKSKDDQITNEDAANDCEMLISLMRPKIDRCAAEQKNPTYAEFWKGYLQGRLDTYSEMQELLEQEGGK